MALHRSGHLAEGGRIQALCGNQSALVQMEPNLERIQKPRRRVQRFSEEEDQQLMAQVERFGTNEWTSIAAHMPNRTSRQCRERWQNYLNPSLHINTWTSDEDARLIEIVESRGPRWKAVATLFPGRTTNHVKNRYQLLRRSRYKEMLRVRTEEALPETEHIDAGQLPKEM